MFKRFKNWIFDKKAEDHAAAGIVFCGVAALAVIGASTCPISLLPTFLTIGKGAAMLSAFEATVASLHLVEDGAKWLFNKVFKRKNKSTSQKSDQTNTKSHTHSNDMDHSNGHDLEDILLRRKGNTDSKSSTPFTLPPIISPQSTPVQPSQTPNNQITLLLQQELSQLRGEIGQLRSQVQSLKNENNSLKKENSMLQEKLSPSKNITDFLGKRTQSKSTETQISPIPRNKVSSSNLALKKKSSKTTSF